MTALVYVHAHDARRRLHDLGVSLEALVSALNAGRLARLSCTDNDPPFIPGTEAWRFVVRVLREQCLPKGWTKSDHGNYSVITNELRKINIVVATGDEMTGIFSTGPKTKSLKGLYTDGAVARNKYQDDMFPETLSQDIKAIAGLLAHPVWILLIHITDDEFRAELSLPNGKDGKSFDWVERIIIPLGDAGSEASSDDLGQDFEVPVKRKA